ncbi:hypothetical protein FA15DRAFT_711509 [Coprinopsis marcescibilis]|uniref:Uncharacterized protein n=1 Tax=Coprinopsis marcescibilis TaxID=230819 RepID=A0A5C3K9Q6_COPMA|nr:hypothetical protein FA15DRAFT_711509 [Coprinopsis marcescibilis]
MSRGKKGSNRPLLEDHDIYDITFRWDFNAPKTAQHNALYKAAFCLDPPTDYCSSFGPCPNEDVTGLGSQISLFVTAIVFSIAMLYMPRQCRAMLYAHLTVTFSLMIAAAISISMSQLTYMDSIFVLVSLGSPASFYLWILSFMSFWRPEYFPLNLKGRGSRGSKIEVQILRTLSLASGAFALALALITFVNSNTIQFSQPWCKVELGGDLWFLLLWMVPLTLQLLATVLLFFVALLLCWLWTKRRGYNAPKYTVLVDSDKDKEHASLDAPEEPAIDLVTWTERVLMDQYRGIMTPTLATSIITVLQLIVIPTFTILPHPGTGLPENAATFLILAVGCFAGKPMDGYNGISKWTFYGVRLLALIVVAAWIVAAALIPYVPMIPTVPDMTVVFMVITVSCWCWWRFSRSSMNILLPLVFISLMGIAIVAAGLLSWYLGGRIMLLWLYWTDSFKFGFQFTAEELESRPLKQLPTDYLDTFMPSMVTYSIWIIMWCATSFWAYKIKISFSELGRKTFARAHILKFCTFIVTPNIVWVESTFRTRWSSPSLDLRQALSFGQLFSLIASVLTVLTLFEEALQVDQPTWAAIFFSRKIPGRPVSDASVSESP